MKALLLQLDGTKLPNMALMRVAAHHRAKGDDVELRYCGNAESLQANLWQEGPVTRYASLMFERTAPIAKELLRLHPDSLVGGTGWKTHDEHGPLTLERFGITTQALDYSIYPDYTRSIGFTQRGCRLKCQFCVVPKKEGAVREAETVPGIYRGDDHARDLVLLDNDFFGQKRWRQRIREIRDGGFRVSFPQGINARTLDARQARAWRSIRCYDDEFKRARRYVAWDNRNDEERLVRGLRHMERAGIALADVTVYMIVGYWHGPVLHEDDFHRVRVLRELGCDPYPMPFARTQELQGFARWVQKGWDAPAKNRAAVSWEAWEAARYRPERLGLAAEPAPLFDGAP